MLYYELSIGITEEITNAIAEKCSAASIKEDKERSLLRKLNDGAAKQVGEREGTVLLFSEYTPNAVTAVAGYPYTDASAVNDDIKSILQAFANQKIKIKKTEITVDCFENRIEHIADMNYARIVRNLSRKLKFDYTDNNTYQVRQSIISTDKLSYQDAVSKAEELMASGDFTEELKRIYSDNHPKAFYGHPVHYKISADEANTAFEQAELLTRCLYCNGRLKGRRIDRINKITPHCYDEVDMRNLFYHAMGGTVVIELAAHEAGDSNYASAYEQVIEFFASLIKKYASDVLVIFVEITKMQGLAKKFTSAVADDIDIIDIQEGSGTKETAQKYMDYLMNKSKLAQFSSDDIVFDKEKYKASEVRRMFNNWTKNSLKDKIYTEYRKQNLKVEQKDESKSDAYEKLMNMVGLNEVKGVIDNIICAYKMQKLRNGYMTSDFSQSRHMIFTGNPGSAKTTVARLVAEILNKEGVLENESFVECGRADLIGKFVGWTAPQVKQKFRQAQGGILFIDEAYSLVDDTGSFADEAINTIVQEMENHRDDVIVIFAGYPDKMKEFMEKNEGLKSRIAFHINFPDYTSDELMQIFKLMMSERGYSITHAGEKAALKLFAQAESVPNFGNGRFARNVLEQSIMRQSSRLVREGFCDAEKKEMLFRLQKEDLELSSVVSKEDKGRAIGFLA